jgi:excisionase family DNA binding protein
MREKLLTLRETAELLRCHPRTVAAWLKQRRLPGVRVAGGWRVLESSLLDLLRGKANVAQKGGDGSGK